MFRTTRFILIVLAALGTVTCGDPRLVGPTAESAHEVEVRGTGVKAAEDDDVPDLNAVARYVKDPGTNGVQWTAAIIGPEGGSVRLGDFEVIVPPGAVDRSTRFEIRIRPEQSTQQRAWAQFKPHNETFGVPVILRVPYETTESAGAENPHVLWWNRKEWEELPTTRTLDGRLQTTTDHFSIYATQRLRGITMVGG